VTLTVQKWWLPNFVTMVAGTKKMSVSDRAVSSVLGRILDPESPNI
jgi:hypothetical protein